MLILQWDSENKKESKTERNVSIENEYEEVSDQTKMNKSKMSSNQFVKVKIRRKGRELLLFLV
jgi:hypothetical protein